MISGTFTFVLHVVTQRLLKLNGFQITWRANLNAWGQLYKLILRQTETKLKFLYSTLLIALVFTTILTFVAIIKS